MSGKSRKTGSGVTRSRIAATDPTIFQNMELAGRQAARNCSRVARSQLTSLVSGSSRLKVTPRNPSSFHRTTAACDLTIRGDHIRSSRRPGRGSGGGFLRAARRVPGACSTANKPLYRPEPRQLVVSSFFGPALIRRPDQSRTSTGVCSMRYQSVAGCCIAVGVGVNSAIGRLVSPAGFEPATY